LTIVTSGGVAWIYVDIPSLIITGILPFLFVSILFGFKEMALSFLVALKKDAEKDKLIKALNFFRTYGKTTWIAGFIAVLIGVIAIMALLEDKKALGPNLALALISLLYSGIINVVIIIPFMVFIKKQMKE
jgi:hypothetical protein